MILLRKQVGFYWGRKSREVIKKKKLVALKWIEVYKIKSYQND